MRSLLIRLTLGLYRQDVAEKELPLIEQWLNEKIVVHEGDLYRLPSKFRAGTIATVQNGTAYLQVLGVSVRDLFIDSDHLGDAKEGDLVIAQRLLGRRGAPSAKIIKIVGRAESYSVAYVQVKNGHRSLADIRNGHPAGAEMSPQELADYNDGDCFQIDNQTHTVVSLLGNLSDPAVDEKIVLAQYNKHDEFSDEVLQLASSFSPEVRLSDYPGRRDLRDLPFCTIDPVTAKDFDDAICYDPEASVLYVAIADVSSYVEPFGPIDAEAIYRSFSIYLPHRSIPMLPRKLSETLCSLQPHVDRLSFVFEMHLDPDTLEVTHSDYYEAIIHSKRRFSYEEVDALFAGDLKPKGDDEKIVFPLLLRLRELTDRLKLERMKKGYDFRSKDLEMTLDENFELASTEYADETPSHALVEDCMLLANKAAASVYERGLFRIHESPSQGKLQTLYQELAGIGIIIEPKASMKETITFIQEQATLRELESEVDTLIIRAQMQARYAPDNKGHFGLGFERYTHFTSPIRRYSDLIVHRLLKAIKAGDTEEGSYVLRNIDALAIAISEKERESSDIEIRFMKRKSARWAAKHIGETFSARINGMENGLTAEIHDIITGVKVDLTTPIPVILFDDVQVRIDNVDLATARINGVVVQKSGDE